MKNVGLAALALLATCAWAEPNEVEIQKVEALEIRSLHLDFELERIQLADQSPLRRVQLALAKEKRKEKSFKIQLGEEARSPRVLARMFN